MPSAHRRGSRRPLDSAEPFPAEPIPPPGIPDPSAYVEAVLDVVESIPPGRVMSYGAIAEFLRDRFHRGSARRVGTVLARYGGAVPWYRVVASNGRLPPGHETEARRLLESEGVEFSSGRVRMRAHAWWQLATGAPSGGDDHDAIWVRVRRS